MAHRNQLVGIIELDADPDADTLSDASLGHTLRRLRNPDGGAAWHVQDTSDAPPPLPSTCWHDSHAPASSAIFVVQGDLRQLQSDLEDELARLWDRLLLPSQ